MEFFYLVKRIVEKHTRAAKTYLAVVTVLLVVCIALGFAAYAVPYNNGSNGDGSGKSLFNVVELDNRDAESGEPTENDETPSPAVNDEDGEDGDDGEVTETETAEGSKSGSKVERNPVEGPEESGEAEASPYYSAAPTAVPTPVPTATPEPTPTPTPTPEPTPTPVPTPVVSLKWKDIPEQVDFGVTYIEDHTMVKGQSRVVSEGEYGIKTTVWEITLVDGVEQSRKIVAIKDTKTPVNKVVAVGTIDSFTDSKGRVMGLSYKIDGDATAYGNSVKYGNGIYYGKMLGGLTTRWGVIAIDPTVIPPGTKVYVKGLNGVNDYGYAIAGDIGGAIKGTRIDLWMDNREIIKIWGIRDVTIYILADQTVDVFELRGDDKWIPPEKYGYVDPETVQTENP